MEYCPENCTITFFPIGDQFTITWSKSDLRSDQDHDLEYCNKVIGDQITWSKSDLRSDQDHFVPYKCVTELKKNFHFLKYNMGKSNFLKENICYIVHFIEKI